MCPTRGNRNQNRNEITRAKKFEDILRDLERGNLGDYKNLSFEEREYFKKIASAYVKGDQATVEALWAVDYTHKPVDPETFFTHSDYLGHFREDVFDAWWPHVFNICNPENKVHEAVLTGCIGSGKSTMGCAMLAYFVHKVLCLKDPAKFYRLGKRSKIVFGVYSLDLKSAEDTGFFILRDQFLAESPFFSDLFRKTHRSDEIIFPHDITIKTGSHALHVAGRNLFAIFVDEMNLMRRGAATASRAHTLATNVSRRLASRFLRRGGDVPGICIFIGSAGSTSDFIENRITTMRENKGFYFVRCSSWEFCRDMDRFCGRRFDVQIGNQVVDSKVLHNVIETDRGYEAFKIDTAIDGCEVIQVPVEFYQYFVEDLDGAIRDYGGRSTSAHSTLFRTKNKIVACQNSDLPRAFFKEELASFVGGGVNLAETINKHDLCVIRGGKYFPRRHDRAPRYIHVDLAKKHDKAGFVMVHPSTQFIDNEDLGLPDGLRQFNVDKHVEVDLAVAVSAGPHGESIDYEKIRKLIFMLRALGYWIRLVTYDSYQSEDSTQRLADAGISVAIFSVDKDSRAYMITKTAVNSGKLKFYPNELLVRELSELRYDIVTNKVDHPDDGSKDVSDALAGAVYSCLTDKVHAIDMVHSGLGSVDEYDYFLQQLKDLQ